jgi:hypothetical protein
MELKKILLLFTSVLLSCSLLFAQTEYTGQTIEDILALPDEEIDLGIACLVLAKDAYPNLKIEVFDRILNFMASELDTLMQGNINPEARIGMINTYLYRPGWWNDSLTFTYDLDDLEASRKDNQFLNGYLSRRVGSCVTMPMLHLVLADRLGWPIQAVRSPKHFFARYMDESLSDKNIEATCGGAFISDQRYITDVEIPEKPIQNGVYLRTLSKKQYLASLMLSNARHFQERESNLERAMYYLHLAVSIDSTLSSGFWNLGITYRLFAKELEKRMISEMNVAYMIHKAEIAAMEQRRFNESLSKQPTYSVKLPEPPEPNLMPPGWKPPSTFPVQPQIQPQQRTPSQQEQQLLAIKQSELRSEIESIRGKFVPQIEEALSRSEWCGQHAEDLGIVHKFPEEFFLKQAKSIEEFKKTGNY